MSNHSLQTAFANFVHKPNSGHKATLLREIEAYPSFWGLQMAEGRNIGEEIAKKLHAGSNYQPEKIDRYVANDSDGNRLSIIFQRRVEDGTLWHVLSWRSVYPGTSSNRRFYMNADGEPWSTTVESALTALKHAKSAGWLEDQYLDQRRRPECDVVVSTDLKPVDREDYLASFIVPGESFGDPELFVVCEDSHQSWRKIMIVNDGRVTFRSVTTKPDYGVLKHLDNQQDWNLDNSMQDCNVQQARVFLRVLESLPS